MTAAKQGFSVRDLTYCAIFAAIIAVLAQITVPLPGGVPFTLQTFAVMLCGLVLGAKRGAVSTLIYLLLALCGVPVLAGLRGGAPMVFGLTGGFLVSFPLLALAAGLVAQKNLAVQLAGLLAGIAVNYAVGTVWFSILSGRSIGEALALCVLPFLITDAIKLVMALLLGPALRKALGKAGVL